MYTYMYICICIEVSQDTGTSEHKPSISWGRRGFQGWVSWAKRAKQVPSVPGDETRDANAAKVSRTVDVYIYIYICIY